MLTAADRLRLLISERQDVDEELTKEQRQRAALSASIVTLERRYEALGRQIEEAQREVWASTWNTCGECGTQLEQACRPGRRKKFCSAACRTAAWRRREL